MSPKYPGRLGAACGEGGDRGEELRHGFARETPSDKDQARPPVVVRPIFELDWRVGDVLDDVDDDRSATFGERHEALDTQQVRTAQAHQHRHCLLEARPAERLFEDQREAVEPVRVVGLGEVEIAPHR